MKCQRCGTEFDTSSVPTNCPKCGNQLPYTEITFRIEKGGKWKESQGRLLFDDDYLRYAKKELTKKPIAVQFLGIATTLIYDALDKNAVLSFKRGAFIDIQKSTGPQGNLFYYEFITKEEKFRILPLRDSQKFEADMDSYIHLKPIDIEEKPDGSSASTAMNYELNNRKEEVSKTDIPVEALTQLKELYEDGILTAEEYSQKKKQILGI